MISTDETNQAIQQAYAMGVTDYIRRPFDTFIVRHRVENTLKLYANQKRLMYLVSDQIPGKRGKQQPDGGNSQSCGGVPQP